MACKPPQVRYLTAGKSLGAKLHKGWALTWNWMLACFAHAKAGKGFSITGIEKGEPKLQVDIRGDGAVVVSCGGDGQPYVIRCVPTYI